jgi:hypothetical protein
VNKPAPRSQDELLTELSLRLSAGADAWDAEKHGWLLAPVMAFIAAWIREIAESLRSLAALIRDGKLVLPVPSAPERGASRPAATPRQRSSHSHRSPSQKRPVPAAAAAHCAPLAEEPAATLAPPRPATPRVTVPPAPYVSRIACTHWPGVGPPIENGAIRAGALARLQCFDYEMKIRPSAAV